MPTNVIEDVDRTNQSVDEAPAVDAEMIERRQETREKLLWEIEILQESRKKTSARVEDRRLELSQVESLGERWSGNWTRFGPTRPEWRRWPPRKQTSPPPRQMLDRAAE